MTLTALIKKTASAALVAALFLAGNKLFASPGTPTETSAPFGVVAPSVGARAVVVAGNDEVHAELSHQTKTKSVMPSTLKPGRNP